MKKSRKKNNSVSRSNSQPVSGEVVSVVGTMNARDKRGGVREQGEDRGQKFIRLREKKTTKTQPKMLCQSAKTTRTDEEGEGNPKSKESVGKGLWWLGVVLLFVVDFLFFC